MSLSARSSAPSVARRCAHLALVGAGLSASVYGLCHLDATDLLLPRGATPPGAEKGGHAQFLTVCSLYLTAATQGLSILATLLGSRILKNIHTVALALSLPLEVVVSALFWPLYLYDSRLLVPTVEIPNPLNPLNPQLYTPPIPLLPNLAWHLFPAVFLLAEYLIFAPPLKKVRTPIVAGLATVSYVLWIQHLHKFNGHYPYPLLDILSAGQRQVVYGVACLLFCIGLDASNRIHRALHPTAWVLADKTEEHSSKIE